MRYEGHICSNDGHSDCAMIDYGSRGERYLISVPCTCADVIKRLERELKQIKETT